MARRSPSPLFRHSLPGQVGFTLVEIMVGLAIGMLATLVILQVFSVFEAQERATTGSANAQTNGNIALYSIGRELQVAGYALMPANESPLACATLTVGTTGIGDIFPVRISNGVATAGVSASDSISIRYGSSPMGGVPTRITAVGAPGPDDVAVTNNFGCQVNDIVLISNGTVCNLTKVTAMSAASTVPSTMTLQDIAGAIAGANIACLGKWNEISYRSNGGNLERAEGAASAVPAIAGIVNLQAQYGISASAASNQVTQWVDATGTWAAPTVADRKRIKAVRIAVVARSEKSEPNAVTSACSSTTAAAPTGLCAWVGSASSPAPVIDLSASDPDWARYHYRVFETIIPLRNIIWSKDVL